MDKQTAVNEIAILLSNAYTAIESAERLADVYGLEFSFNPAYGMGGTYYGEGSEERSEAGWLASSQSC